MNNFTNPTFIFNILLHAIPLILAIRIIITHYIVKPKRSKADIPDTVDHALLFEYAQDNNRVIHTLLNLMVFVVIAMIFDTFFILNKVEHTTEENSKKTSQVIANLENKDVFVRGTDGIYEVVNQEFINRGESNQPISIDILGYTLFSVEPKLLLWYEKGYLKNLSVKVMYLNPEFIKTSKQIDPFWEERVKSNLAQINNFKKEKRSFLERNHVTIDLVPYNHIPGVHGFRFRGGKYFVSFSTWDIEGHIKLPTEDTYFIVENDDRTEKGRTLRKLMDNWFDAKLGKSK